MAAVDRHAIDVCGVPGAALMERAGQAVVDFVLAEYPNVRRPLVVCGSGNNGGDGFVIARVLEERRGEIRARILLVGDRARYGEDARLHLEKAEAASIEIVQTREPSRIERLCAASDLIVDAVFGVGLSRPVEGELADVLAVIGASAAPIVAADIPSGVCSTSGRELGVSVPADAIVTFGLPKQGLALHPSSARIHVADIGFPPVAVSAVRIAQRCLTHRAVLARLPDRRAAGHKGTFGHVLVIGGATGKLGAPCLSALGAMRTGAGLVTVAVAESLVAIAATKLLEAMTLPIPDEGSGYIGDQRLVLDTLARAARARDVVVIGPGLGTAPQTRRGVEAFLAELDRPAVVDADALNVFSRAHGGDPARLASPHPRVLTPHPGEAARLLDCTTPEIEHDRPAAARELARATGAIVLLKGARTLIAAPSGELFINPTGGPALAAGGSGDVLAGAIGALLAQGVDPLYAAASGAYLHGLAGSPEVVGLLASEVATRIPQRWHALLAQGGEDTDDDARTLRAFPDPALPLARGD